jgi:colanic acid/amylovoran biosynthesis glycosyltransferase
MHNITLAILTPSKDAYSETFIQKHIDYLPFKKVVIYGGVIPDKMVGEEDNYLPISFFGKVLRRLKKNTGNEIKEFKELRLKYFLKKQNVNVVLAEYVLTGSHVCAVCEELNIPIVATGLGYELSMYKVINDNKKLYQHFFKYCSAIIVVAKSMTKVLTDLGCDREKIIHSPAGASEDFFELKPNYQSMQLFAIGRFIEKKSPHITLLSFYNVLQKFPEARLVFAGDGPLLSFCKDIASALKIEDKINFVGKVTQDQQRKFLQESRLFVQHSRIASDGDSEGTPVAIVEASSAGLPVVSTIHAGIIDVVVNNETGFLVEEGDIEGMTTKIIELLDSAELSEKFGMAGKTYIKENFTLKQHITAIEKAILKSLE